MAFNQDKNEELIGILNAQLANILDLFSMMKHAHWNVSGPQFLALHKLFGEIAAGLLTYVDKIAERIATQGGMALGILRVASETSQLEPYPLRSSMARRRHWRSPTVRLKY
jgi:starvation-inducible DNA-binding protein